MTPEAAEAHQKRITGIARVTAEGKVLKMQETDIQIKPAATFLEIPYPPTVNNYFTVARGRKILSKRGREYRVSVLAAIGPRKPLLARLSIVIWLFPPDKRRRDLDNVTKAVFDALQHAGVYRDDEQIDFFSVTRGAIVKGGRCTLDVQTL